MKAFSLSLLSWLTLSGCAAAQNAYLYNLDIHPSTTSSSTSSSIDSETANAILGRRLGATESLKIGNIENVVLEHLNQYGGQQPISMFSDEGSPFVTSRVVIGIEGYDGERLPALPGVTIERASTDLASISYMENLVNRKPEIARCNIYMPLKCGAHITHIADPKEGACLERDEIVRMMGEDTNGHIKGNPTAIRDALYHSRGKGSRSFMKLDLTRMTNISPEARNFAIAKTFADWYKVLESLAMEGKVESTILIFPSQRAPSNLNLSRRNLLSKEEEEKEEEEPLSQPFVSASSPVNPSPSEASNSTTPLPPLGSFLPSCFPTNGTCNDQTNSCSGRGACYAKSSKCFACKCGSTIVRQDSDGKNVKTVQWGGSACERKDISVPFFLFAGFGVFMSALVVGSVGMLYGMGSEELPSVIGAGVTGPRAQR